MLLAVGCLVVFRELPSSWRTQSQNHLGGFQIHTLISTLLAGVSKSRALTEVQISQKR